MRAIYRILLLVLIGLLALCLILAFWPLSIKNQAVLCLLTVLVCGILGWRQRSFSLRHSDVNCDITVESLPPEGFQGAVILACADNAGLFEPGKSYRETREGWYLRIEDAGQLRLWAQSLSFVRPALISQISILLAIVPEYHHSADSFTQCLRGWQRAIIQCCSWLGGVPPIWTVTWISPPGICTPETPLWFSATNHRSGVGVHWLGESNLSLADWIGQYDSSGHISRLSQLLWLDSLLGWQAKNLDSLFAERQGDLAVLQFCLQGFCITPIAGQRDNLWWQHITCITSLPPNQLLTVTSFPLPERLLKTLPRRRGVSQQMVFWRYAGLSCAIFLVLAMQTSFINNQNLLRSVGDHLALYQRLSGTSPESKTQAQQRLWLDIKLLDDWLRQGEPLGYSMGFYQGGRLIAAVEAALHDWVSPKLAAPVAVINNQVPTPEAVHLEGMSLFDPGKSALKSGSEKVLINSLMGIKGKPGWLIVISGHTDNTGNRRLNRRLSLLRAEAVHDWIKETGDIPESCFVVRGLGDSHPVASNDTPEGRARNRRVEIRLVPQAEACQVPGNTSTSFQDDDVNAD